MKQLITVVVLFLFSGCTTYVNRGVCAIGDPEKTRLELNIYEYLGQSNSECKDQVGSNFGRLNRNTCYVMVIPGGNGEQCPIIIHGEYYLLFNESTLKPLKKKNYVENYKLHF